MPTKFDFISPGVLMREIDLSTLPPTVDEEGPVIIGRTRKGPGLKPVKVRNIDDFISVFGRPVPGGAAEGDMWRSGNLAGPTYASYAAQAWLKNNSPLTFVRLMGEEHPKSTSDIGAKAGWTTSNANFSKTEATNGGAYALFLIDSSSLGDGGHYPTGTLAAVWYLQSGSIALTGTVAAGVGGSTTGASPSIIINFLFYYKSILVDNLIG